MAGRSAAGRSLLECGIVAKDPTGVREDETEETILSGQQFVLRLVGCDELMVYIHTMANPATYIQYILSSYRGRGYPHGKIAFSTPV